MPHGSGRPPDAMDDQLKKAGAMATELLKLLTGLPSPWNRRFHVFNRRRVKLLSPTANAQADEACGSLAFGRSCA
jgi:hypothetical protein